MCHSGKSCNFGIQTFQMPVNKFYLDDQKTQEITLSWRGFWKDITVAHNGHVLGGFQNFSHLKQGQSFHLHDGTLLNIHYSTSYGDQGIRVNVNGRPLKGSSGDPEVRLKSIFGISAFIGGLSMIVGAIAELGKVHMLLEMGVGWVSMVIGAVVIGLGYLVWKSRSVPALIVLLLIVVGDIFLTIIMSVADGGQPAVGGIVIKVFLIVAMVKGFGAIQELKDKEAQTQRNPANGNPFG